MVAGAIDAIANLFTRSHRRLCFAAVLRVVVLVGVTVIIVVVHRRLRLRHRVIVFIINLLDQAIDVRDILC